jgi:prophage regulatory protein
MTKLLLRDDLKSRGIPYSNMHLHRLEAAGRFPKRLRVGARAAWLENEIEDWLQARVAERDAKLKPTDGDTPQAAA